MTTVFTYCLAFRYRLNGLLLTIYLNLCGCKAGRGLKVLRFPTFKDVPRGNIEIGNRVSIGRGVVFEIPKEGSLIVNDRVTIGDYNRFSSMNRIEIGSKTAIGENVSIRGSFHGVKRELPIIDQPSKSEPIFIGQDVLIGAYSVVLQGSHIPDGVVIGAKSLVRSRDELNSYGIFAGTPLKLIRFRE